MKVVLQNLTKKFPGRGKEKKDVIAVNNFNFEIPDGTLVGLFLIIYSIILLLFPAFFFPCYK